MKNEFMGVIFTNHAIERLHQRKITQADAWYTFKHPDQQSKGKSLGSWKYSKSYGNQTLQVIAKQNEAKQWVILSCWSKILGNNQPIFKKTEKSWLETMLKKIFKKKRTR